MAAVGAGHFASVAEGCDTLLKIKTRAEPIPCNSARYNEHYQIYKELYADLRGTFAKQAELVGRYISK